MPNEFQTALYRAMANQIMSRAADPERFLMSYGTQLEKRPDLKSMDLFKPCVEHFEKLKAEAPAGLSLHGMRQYFYQIRQGGSQESFDVWMVNGLHADRGAPEAYKRYLESETYLPCTDAGRDRVKAIDEARLEAEANKGKSGWFGDMAKALGHTPTEKPATDNSELSQQIQALAVQVKLNHDDLLTRLEDIETKI